jgi:translation initiation factor 2 beta subunit (eIF-2beta)/eIF-5
VLLLLFSPLSGILSLKESKHSITRYAYTYIGEKICKEILTDILVTSDRALSMRASPGIGLKKTLRSFSVSNP